MNLRVTKPQADVKKSPSQLLARPSFGTFPADSPSVSHKASCSCGGGCPSCQARSDGLKISQPHDPAEIEADAITDRVMRMSASDFISSTSSQIKHRADKDENTEVQRKVLPSHGVPLNSPDHVKSVITSGGRGLDSETRNYFEPRLGYDLSSVRIHTGSAAGRSARDIDARAYTLGNNIVFDSGEYIPESESGKKLLAHELVHVFQQTGADLAQGISRSDHLLARQPTSGTPVNVPGPSPTSPDADKFEDARSKRVGVPNNPAMSTWGWGGDATKSVYQQCTVVPMAKERFDKFRATLPKLPPKPHRRSSTDGPSMVLGSTWPDIQSSIPPKIAAETVQEDGKTKYRLKPTRAEMPLIKSAHMKAGVFEDGERVFLRLNPDGSKVCPDMRRPAPVFWIITEAGANKLWAGEMEHCSDIREAFNVTLALYASVINNEAAAERRYESEQQAVDETKKRLQSIIPLDPDDMRSAYAQEAEKTRMRDTSKWHEGTFAPAVDPTKNNCKGWLGTIDGTSFPEVGDGPGKEVHSPYEVIEGYT